VLEGLAAYVRALDPAACPASARQPLTVQVLMADVRRALIAAEAKARAGDAPAAVVLAAAARARLGLIDERYAGAGLAPQRDRLRAADRSLAEAQAALRAKRPDAARDLAAWLSQAPALEAFLAAREPASLFDPDRLRQAANRRLPQGAS
jgi:hypothetical protein